MYGFDQQANPLINVTDLIARQNSSGGAPQNAQPVDYGQGVTDDPTQQLESGASSFRSAVGNAAQNQQGQFSALQTEMIRQQQQQQAQQPGGIRRFFAGMLQGMGAAAMKEATGMSPAEMEYTRARTAETMQQTQQLALETELFRRRLATMQNAGANVPGLTDLGNLSPDEQAQIEAAKFAMGQTGEFAPMLQAIHNISGQRAIQSRQFKNIQGLGMWDFRDPNNPQPVANTAPPTVTVTKELASQLGVPEQLIGQNMPLQQLSPFVRAMAFGSVPVQGAQGPALVNRNPLSQDFGKVTKLGLGSPAQAGAYWNAKYGLVRSLDEDGNPIYVPRDQAAGAPVADNAFNIMKGKAGLENFRDALNRISNNMEVLNDPGQRALVARTLRNIGVNTDPGIIWSALGNATASGLSQQGADLVAATLNAREWIGANRSFAGNFRGSEALYQRMVGNVPGPANSAELNRALIQQDMDNTARVERKLRGFQGGPKVTPQGGATPVPQTGGSNFFSNFGGVQHGGNQ